MQGPVEQLNFAVDQSGGDNAPFSTREAGTVARL